MTRNNMMKDNNKNKYSFSNMNSLFNKIISNEMNKSIKKFKCNNYNTNNFKANNKKEKFNSSAKNIGKTEKIYEDFLKYVNMPKIDGGKNKQNKNFLSINIKNISSINSYATKTDTKYNNRTKSCGTCEKSKKAKSILRNGSNFIDKNIPMMTLSPGNKRSKLFFPKNLIVINTKTNKEQFSTISTKKILMNKRIGSGVKKNSKLKGKIAKLHFNKDYLTDRGGNKNKNF